MKQQVLFPIILLSLKNSWDNGSSERDNNEVIRRLYCRKSKEFLGKGKKSILERITADRVTAGKEGEPDPRAGSK